MQNTLRRLSVTLLGCVLWCVQARLVCAGGESPNAPWSSEAKPLPLQDSVTQFGIRWSFSQSVPVGRFVNGDFYVVGPVTVVAIDPPPLVGSQVPPSELGERERSRINPAHLIRNGSMLNLAAPYMLAFDSGMRNYFDPAGLVQAPLQLKPGDRLISTISLKQGEKPQFPYHSSGVRDQRDNSPVRTAAVLTCVNVSQPVDAFRPAYGDPALKVYRARDLKREYLQKLPRPKDAPPINHWFRVFERPWVNAGFFGFDHPMENMPHYGQWVGQAMSCAGLMLMMDFKPKDKEPLLISLVQVGIDYWGLVRNGHPGWQGWGGHGSGRKFPIVFAGIMLGDSEMASPTKLFPKVEFGEDNQTMYGEGWTGARALFAGHSGVQSASGKPERPHWGPYEHLHPSKWSKSQLSSEQYRRANTSSAWVGQALVLRWLKAEDEWCHDAFFDYVDRWMSEKNDAQHRQEIMKYHPEAGLGERATYAFHGFAGEPFVKSMWDRHRGPITALRPQAP